MSPPDLVADCPSPGTKKRRIKEHKPDNTQPRTLLSCSQESFKVETQKMLLSKGFLTKWTKHARAVNKKGQNVTCMFCKKKKKKKKGCVQSSFCGTQCVCVDAACNGQGVNIVSWLGSLRPEKQRASMHTAEVCPRLLWCCQILMVSKTAIAPPPSLISTPNF